VGNGVHPIPQDVNGFHVQAPAALQRFAVNRYVPDLGLAAGKSAKRPAHGIGIEGLEKKW